jgi:uncharacterized protein (DUF342 family)
MKVTRSDIANTQKSIDVFCSRTSDGINRTVSSLNDFINYSNLQLRGKAWDTFRNKMKLYCNNLEYARSVCGALQSISNESNMAMLSYLTPFDSIDNEKLEEIKEQIEGIKRTISRLNEMLYEQVLVTDKSEDELVKDAKEYYVFKYSDKDRKSFSTEMIALEEEVKKLEILLEKIEGLGEKDRELFGRFTESTSNFDLEEKLSELPVTKI